MTSPHPQQPDPSDATHRPRASLLWPLVSLLLGGVCIAFAPIFVRLADVGPVSVVMWRLGLSIPFVLLFALKNGRAVGTQQPTARSWFWLIVSGVMLATDLALWHIAIHQTSVANSTFLINLAPIFVTLGAFWFLGESVGGGFILALGAAIAGAALLVQADFGGANALRGDLTAVAAAVFYAGYQLTVKYCRAAFSTAMILAVTAIVTTVVLLPVVFLMGEVVLPRSLNGWAVVIGIALVCQVLGQGLITWAVAHTKANLASVVLLIQPVVAAWLALLIWGETLAGLQLVGCALVLAGIVLARRSS